MISTSSTEQFARATAAVEFIRSKMGVAPTLGIVLGSGLGEFAAEVEGAVTIPYAEIPHFPQSTVVGHSGRLVLGTMGGVAVAVMQGRVHAYEGYGVGDVVFPTRVLGLLGCRTLLVTNAAGGIRTSLTEGALVVISDHINLTGINAAVGPNEPRFGLVEGAGQRFFDMSTAYSPRLRRLARAVAEEQGFELTEGVYVGVLGPSFETPAEIRAFRTLGADLVGMSTVQEVIVARHMGIEVLGISVVTNMAAGVLEQAIDHAETLEVGRRVAWQFAALLKGLIPRIGVMVVERMGVIEA